MTPAARVQTTIDLLDGVTGDNRPADLAARRFLRARRYIGSKDRRAITDLAFAVIRGMIRLDWRLAAAGGGPTSRHRVLAALIETGQDVSTLFDGSTYGPPRLDDGEIALAAALKEQPADKPDHVAGNFPAWLEPELRVAFGADLVPEMAAFDRPAPVDLRVNTARADRDSVLAALRSFGLDCEPTPWSPVGVRVHGRPQLATHPAVRDGLIELQDEGAQLAARLVAPEAARVIDFCAGAGGKTLALADAMAAVPPDRRRLVAADIDGERLGRLAPRAERAGIDWIERHVLAEGDDPWLSANAGQFDRVLVDAPCSGTGTWRRQPDGRQRLTPEKLETYRGQQAEILDRAAGLVAPGGRLIYVTCAILPSENQDQIDQFLVRRAGFELLPVADIWATVLDRSYPGDGPTLQLTPHRHGVDGFFIAVLTRRVG